MTARRKSIMELALVRVLAATSVAVAWAATVHAQNPEKFERIQPKPAAPRPQTPQPPAASDSILGAWCFKTAEGETRVDVAANKIVSTITRPIRGRTMTFRNTFPGVTCSVKEEDRGVRENARCKTVLGAVTRDAATFSAEFDFLLRPYDPGKPAQRNEIAVSHRLEMLNRSSARYAITYSKFLIDGKDVMAQWAPYAAVLARCDAR